MNVLIANSLYSPHIVGGAERSVQFLAEALGVRGHSVTVVTTTPNRTPSYKRVNGVSVHYLPLKNIYWPHDHTPSAVTKATWHLIDNNNLFMSRSVERILNQDSFDLIHTNTVSGFSVALWRLAHRSGLPIVHTLRDYYLLCPSTTMFKKGENCQDICLACSFYARARRSLSTYVDAVVGNSKFILDRHLNEGFFRNAKQGVIYNAYEAREANKSHPSRQLRLGYLGRLGPTKGVEHLIMSLAQLPSVGWSLAVAGRGETSFVASLERAAADLPVSFLGFVDPATFFEHIDVLIVPSLWHEPLPRTIFEAYAHGVPVIGSCRGGIPEIIDEGETGFVFDPDDSEDLAQKVKMFLDTPQLSETMTHHCLSKANDFLPETILQHYENVYEAVVQRTRQKSRSTQARQEG